MSMSRFSIFNSSSIRISSLSMIAVSIFLNLSTPLISQEDEDIPRPSADKTFTQSLEEQERLRSQYDAAVAENRAERDSKFGVLPEDAPEDLRKEYQSVLDAMRRDLQQVRRRYTNYNVAAIDGNDLVRLRQWQEAMHQCDRSATAWLTKMSDIYASDPNKYANLGFSLMEIIRGESKMDRVSNLLTPCRAIFVDPPAALDPALLEGIGFAAYANNDYQLARDAWRQYELEASLPATKKAYNDSIDEAAAKWENELKQRNLDKTRNNPIVQLVTSKGIITIELFEDQAPLAVANFIYLIENQFYKSIKIYRVISNFCVQTGCNIGDGTGNAGYSIASEADREDRRDVFRGSLFFALGTDEKTGEIDVDSASSQFLIASCMLPRFNQSVTVFGRVIDGDYVVGSFRKVDLSEKSQREDKTVVADFLVESNVLSKRDHVYKPKPLFGELPF